MKYEKYEKPQVADYGDLTELTAGLRVGGHLDTDFAAGAVELGFSGPCAPSGCYVKP